MFVTTDREKMDTNIQTSNFNTKWLDNIYENIKKMEEHERNCMEGCQSIIEYLSIPFAQRDIIIKDAQYKNLKFFLTEFQLLLSDLSPILKEEKLNQFKTNLDTISGIINKRELFLSEVYDVNRNLKSIRLTKFFDDTLTILSKLKVSLFMEIKTILYIKDENPW